MNRTTEQEGNKDPETNSAKERDHTNVAAWRVTKENLGPGDGPHNLRTPALPPLVNSESEALRGYLENRPAYLQDFILALGQANYTQYGEKDMISMADLADKIGYKPRSDVYWNNVYVRGKRANPETHNAKLGPIIGREFKRMNGELIAIRYVPRPGDEQVDLTGITIPPIPPVTKKPTIIHLGAEAASCLEETRNIMYLSRLSRGSPEKVTDEIMIVKACGALTQKVLLEATEDSSSLQTSLDEKSEDH